jgi:hypothetical protein
MQDAFLETSFILSCCSFFRLIFFLKYPNETLV